ncbi:MAG: heme exporter protein CcmD [Hyphomicrobiaceae bacterium]
MSHTGFVALSYGLTVLVIGLLFGWILLTGRARRAQLDRLAADRGEPSDER